MFNATGKLVEKPGVLHYTINTFCLTSPCVNGATCIPDYEQDIYGCRCLPGFNGKHCEHEINECSSNPCLNGGVCMANRYQCSCPDGFNGSRCEIARSTEKEARGPPTATGRWFGGLDAPPPKTEMLARPAPLFDAHATMAALENLISGRGEREGIRTSVEVR
ncbi:hypothetical protein QZH41_001273 [Actinostola sp. cb2023]|nr:hypothetical protein QZH41_001273 [Actinostola sp. cb2023]